MRDKLQQARENTQTSESLANLFRERLLERHQEPEKWRGLQFGHSDLDKLTGGLRKGEFCVIAGAQKAGKTTASLAILLQILSQIQEDEAVVFVSLEMTHDALASRLLSNLSDIDITKFRDLTMKEDDWKKLDTGVARLEKTSGYWNVGANDIDTLEQLVELIDGDQQKVRLVVVDYFQLMSGNMRSYGKRFEQLEEISQRLKSMALQKNLSVIAISQQSRESLKSVSRQKDPNTLAGTQSLARDCDLLLVILPFIEDSKEINHLRRLYVALARNSSADVMYDAYFSGAFCKFGAVANAEIEQLPPPKDSYWNK